MTLCLVRSEQSATRAQIPRVNRRELFERDFTFKAEVGKGEGKGGEGRGGEGWVSGKIAFIYLRRMNFRA